jgi:hypothetical protein
MPKGLSFLLLLLLGVEIFKVGSVLHTVLSHLYLLKIEINLVIHTRFHLDTLMSTFREVTSHKFNLFL